MKLVYRQHALRRMFEREISAEEVVNVLIAGRIIEDYPDDIPYSSTLWFGQIEGRPLHVVVAENLADEERIIVTVYQPNPVLWEADWATRRRKT